MLIGLLVDFLGRTVHLDRLNDHSRVNCIFREVWILHYVKVFLRSWARLWSSTCCFGLGDISDTTYLFFAVLARLSLLSPDGALRRSIDIGALFYFELNQLFLLCRFTFLFRLLWGFKMCSFSAVGLVDSFHFFVLIGGKRRVFLLF